MSSNIHITATLTHINLHIKNSSLQNKTIFNLREYGINKLMEQLDRKPATSKMS